MTILGTLLSTTGTLLLVWLLLDRAMPVLLRWLEPILPNDVAGHGGLFVDTLHGKGIFDRGSI